MAGLLRARFGARRIPVRVSFLVTKYCNLRCFYCYAKDNLNQRTLREPTLADLKMIIDQIHAAGCRWINILGGEPLIRDDIEALIDYARARQMFIEITTNGCFVPRRIEALKKVDHLCISLDGDREANDRSRGVGSFERIVAGIECAVAHGLGVRIHATLCRRTMRPASLAFLTDFCNRLGIRLNYSENGLPGIERLDPDFLLSAAETLAFYQRYRGLKRNGFPIISSDVAVDYVARWPLAGRTTIYRRDLARVPAGSFYPCRLGRNQCFVDVNGGVYACTKRWG